MAQPGGKLVKNPGPPLDFFTDGELFGAVWRVGFPTGNSRKENSPMDFGIGWIGQDYVVPEPKSRSGTR